MLGIESVYMGRGVRRFICIRIRGISEAIVRVHHHRW